MSCYPKRDEVALAFFFFQAEDGIRDIGVTGVQTCALPISVQWCERIRTRAPAQSNGQPGPEQITLITIGFGSSIGARATRSEECRVGKEGRSRRSPDH